MTDADAVPIHEQLEPEEIRAYQVYLATKRQLATSSVIVALRDTVTLKKDWRTVHVLPIPIRMPLIIASWTPSTPVRPKITSSTISRV